ncbi:MAG: NAD(P)H-hydrate epimerase, partial [Solirubrobacteraceae bacterium]
MALPGWLIPLPDAQAQRALDTWAIEVQRIPGETLMEHAGAGLAQACSERAPQGEIAVVCGRGNNAGDGFVAARLLIARGRTVRVLLCADPGAYAGDARTNLERLPAGCARRFSPELLDGAPLLLDALLGTGSSGPPREPIAGAIESINAARRADPKLQVIACDVPSGVDASTGEVPAGAVMADATVTFHAAKPGLWITPGKGCAGQVQVVAIGIPEGGPGAPTVGQIGPAVRDLVPRRAAAATKFSAGSVLVAGGSRGLSGAPVMASLAAARAGAGYVTVAVPASVGQVVAAKLLEVMTVELPDDEGGGLQRGSARIAVERAGRA